MVCGGIPISDAMAGRPVVIMPLVMLLEKMTRVRKNMTE